MYFENYGLRKRWLDERLKNRLSEDPSTSNIVKGRNTVAFWTKVPLPYLLITVNIIQLEKVSFSTIKKS